MQTPAPNRPIRSAFGPRVHPVTGQQSFHYGVDFGGSFPVQAAADGVVEKVGYSRTGYGHYVIIRHNTGLKTLYAHGAHKTHYVEGQFIKAGAIIFQSGSTGMSTGNHLHFEVRVRKNLIWHRVDPMPYIAAKPQPEQQEEIVGAFYRDKKSGGIWWQEKPNTPLIPIDLPTWTAYSANGNKYADLEPAQVSALIAKWGTVPAPSSPGAPAPGSPKSYVGTLELKEQ